MAHMLQRLQIERSVKIENLDLIEQQQLRGNQSDCTLRDDHIMPPGQIHQLVGRRKDARGQAGGAAPQGFGRGDGDLRYRADLLRQFPAANSRPD